MTTFFLILMLLDSMQFGYAGKPRLRKVPVVNAARRTVNTEPSPPVCTPDANGELTCYPIDQADKFKR